MKWASLCFAMKENILDGFLADIKKHLPFKIVFEMAEVWEQENKEKITPPKNRTTRQIIPHPEAAVKEERQSSMQTVVKSLFNVIMARRPLHLPADGACSQGALPPLERDGFEKLVSFPCTAQRVFSLNINISWKVTHPCT